MFQFEMVWAFVLLPLPLIVAWLAPAFRDSGESLRVPFFARLVDLSGQKPRRGAVVLHKGWLQRFNFLLTWVLVVSALAKPVWIDPPIVQEKFARDLLLIVDLSGSMEEPDFTNETGEAITRLDAVKLVLRDFIARRKKDRIGLAVFGNAAFPQAPFTEDHQTVLALLDELQTGMAGPKTMIGDAIGLAIRLYEASETNDKVAILLTDGNDSGSQMPIPRAVEVAAENRIQIHTIAMGDPKTVGEKELDTEILEEMSTETGGSFFLALNREELSLIYDKLDKLEDEKVETISYRPKRALFYYPIAVLIICNLLLVGAMIASPSRWERANV